MGGRPPHREKVGDLVLRWRSSVDHRVAVDVGEVLPLSARKRSSHGRNSAQKQGSERLSFSMIDLKVWPRSILHD
jgi:hypothetical protein